MSFNEVFFNGTCDDVALPLLITTLSIAVVCKYSILLVAVEGDGVRTRSRVWFV
jgi:hypothetical protein